MSGFPRIKIASICAALAMTVAACARTAAPPSQISPPEIARADLARLAPAPIPVSPRVAKIYQEDYLAELTAETSAVFAISPNGNRFALRFCRHPDCGLSDDELAARAIDRCNVGVPRQNPALRCLVFDRNGRIVQPNRIWSDADFDAPASVSPLVLTDPAAVAPGRFVAMTPEGELVVSLRPDGRANFWDIGDGFHQGTWSLKDGGICVDSVDQRATVTCGRLYGADTGHITGASLDLYPGKFLPVTRITTPE